MRFRSSRDAAAAFLLRNRKARNATPEVAAVKKPARPLSRHSQLIAKLVEDGAETLGFSRRVVAAVAGRCKGDHEPLPSSDNNEDGGPEDFDCMNCMLRDDVRHLRIIPDAFGIKRKKMEVTAYEVEDTNPVSDNKLADYQRWWWILDEHYWMLRLVIINRFGHTFEVELFSTSLPKGADARQVAALRDVMGIRTPGGDWVEQEGDPI